ncbi:transmembrane secretion effector [Murinocardiopsis flavida]|uniref:Transmembrane secretion effector n=1 Tax=Murinocardiopsis flavida TaxID=645275 RepID=A0A2P8DEM2_9ACTN|nr:MFS transporter [Murinocardiopsis flavida]PSK95638.1 transmembrane secretion effector [Murinocardiopsis flavida]
MGYARLLGTPRIAGLWAAQLLAVLGARLYALAVMWLVWETTASAFLMGLVAVLESVPYVIMGAVGRRVLARMATLPRLAGVELARAGIVGVLPLLWAVPEARTPALLAVALLLGITGALIDPVLPGLVPGLVDRADAQPVMGLLDLTGRIARILGPGSAGALLLLVSEVQFYWLTAGGFAVSAAALWAIGRHAGTAAPPQQEEDRELPAALPLLRAHPAVAFAVSLHGFGIFAGSAAAIGMPILLTTTFDGDAADYGVITAITAAGALAGNLVVGNARIGGGWLTVYCGAWLASGLTLAGMGAAPNLWALWGVALLSGAAAPISGVALHGVLASQFDQSARVALLATDQMVIRAAGTAGMLIVPLYVVVHPPLAFAASGLALAGCAVAGLAMAPRLSPAPVRV